MLFSKEEETLIVEAIRWAERKSSGEIRLFVEDFCYRDSPVERASEIFAQYGMFHTTDRNGVLIYIAEKSHQFAIWGDVGIHDKVGFSFWKAEKEIMREHFISERYAEGVCKVIKQISHQLEAHFPHGPDDKNELPDEIIYGS